MCRSLALRVAAIAVGVCISVAGPNAALGIGFNDYYTETTSATAFGPAFVFGGVHDANRRNARRNMGPLWARVSGNGGSEKQAPPGRRKKKNKYASFSKADKQEKDPFEALISESMAKVKDIEVEKARKKNKKVHLDEEEMRLLRQEKRVRNKMQFPDTKSIDPYDPTTYGYTELGTVLGAHGVHGLLKVLAVTEFAERLCKPGVRHLKAHNRRSPREVRLLEGRHRLGEEYLVKLEGIGDRNAANKLRSSVLYALQKERPSIEEDEFLISDLVGLDVYLDESYSESDGQSSSEENIDSEDKVGRSFVGLVGGILLGEDMSSIPGLGQDMLEIVLPRGRGGTPSWRDELVLIPFVPQIVPTVDLESGAIYISPPPGLLDLTYIKEEKVRIKGFLPPAKEA